MVALDDSTPQPGEDTPPERDGSQGAVSPVTRRKIHGAETTKARTALVEAILNARPPRARRTAWRLARSFLLAVQGAAEAGMLVERGFFPGERRYAEEASRHTRNALESAALGLEGHTGEGSTALALVQVLTGFSGVSLARGWGVCEMREYARDARGALEILSELEPPRSPFPRARVLYVPAEG